MKHLTKSTKWMIGSLTFAVALTSLAQNTSGQERLLTQNDVANKLQQYSVESEGVSIRPADASLVWSAAEQFKGKNVSLDLPKSGDALASNSVLIGSGSDGLVSDNNLEKKDTQYILNPPFKPKTSITLVGRPGKQAWWNKALSPTQNITYCILALENNKKQKAITCRDLNKAIRLKEGTYLVNYMGMNLKVSLKENENKVIYLREVFVPKQIKLIAYKVKMHNSDVEQINNIMTFIKNNPIHCEGKDGLKQTKNLAYKINIRTNVDILDYEYSWVENSCNFKNSILDGSLSASEFYNKLNQDINFVIGSDNEFISVLPGTYKIEWHIDNEVETTELKID